jgi:hypothetical protein
MHSKRRLGIVGLDHRTAAPAAAEDAAEDGGVGPVAP